MEVLQYCIDSLHTCLSPAHLHEFIMRFDGPCGDGSTLDTLKLKPVGTCSNSLLAPPFGASSIHAWVARHRGLYPFQVFSYLFCWVDLLHGTKEKEKGGCTQKGG